MMTGSTMSVYDEFVHPPRSKSSCHCINNHFTSVDVANYLGFPLGGVCPFLQENNWCGLGNERQGNKGVMTKLMWSQSKIKK